MYISILNLQRTLQQRDSTSKNWTKRVVKCGVKNWFKVRGNVHIKKITKEYIFIYL